MKCGTENEDTEVLNFTSKLVPFGSGYDHSADDAGYTPGGDDSRKGRQIFYEIVRERKVQNKNISELAGAVQIIILNRPSKFTENKGVGTFPTRELFTLTNQLIEIRELDDNSRLTRQSLAVTEAAL